MAAQRAWDDSHPSLESDRPVHQGESTMKASRCFDGNDLPHSLVPRVLLYMYVYVCRFVYIQMC